MNIFLQLSFIAVLPVAVSIALYTADKKTRFGKLNPKIRQLIIGVVFGGLAVLGTEFGVDVGGAVANTRDASVLTAGLLFGAPAGIIAGMIGGIERWFAVLWGAGTYTRIACSVSTIIAGFIGALLRKFMFSDKKPSWIYALGIGLVTEVLHMLMIFVTNMSDIQTAFTFVEKCSLPMITVNGVSVMLSTALVTWIGKEPAAIKKNDKQITTQFQKGLLINVLLAIIVSSLFTTVLQNSISKSDTYDILSLNLSDVKADISDASDKNLLDLTHKIANKLSVDSSPLTNDSIAALANEYNVADICVVDESGRIIFSNIETYIGYDMASGEQSAEFLVLLDGVDEYVQSYQPISYDRSLSRKYAGVALDSGGFIQVGYDAKNFQSDIAGTVEGLTRNRHVGARGCIVIVDMSMNIVSDSHGYEGQIFDQSTAPSTVEEGSLFTATVFGEKSYCMYKLNEGYYIIAILPVSEANFSRNIAVYVMFFMEILIFVCLFVLVYFLVKELIVKNIRKINDSLSQITGGNLNVTVDVRSNEEFASLSDDINSTVLTLKRYIAEAAARIDKELEFAKSIQHSALPSVFPPYPDRGEFDIFASMDAAKEVGGDFYDFYFTGANTLAFLIADVSGKGIPAAMFMMRAKTLLKGYAESGLDAEEVLTAANEKLCEGNDAEMFVTAWFGKLDLLTGEVAFANAGHNPPVVKKADGSCCMLKSRPGFVLAGMEGVLYKKNTFRLEPGDAVFFYTDGVTEAMDSASTLYGDNRLLNVIGGTDRGDPAFICSAVKADVDAFVKDAPQFDDITMLCLKYNGGGGVQ